MVIAPTAFNSVNSSSNGASIEESPSPSKTPAVLRLPSSYPVIPRSELTVLDQLGAGSYGSVFRGIWAPHNNAPNGVIRGGSVDSASTSSTSSTPITVALKKVFMLEKEVDILCQIRHRNIIQFFGISHANPDFFIVTEFAENGSLYDYLHNADAEMPCERILKWTTQIAHGVYYLHYDAPATIIHRDLKSKNVVIGAHHECKLCDFGTSKDLTHSMTEPTWGGTAAWMSPEIIDQREGITTATDVWSFGVLLWEMFTREVPYQGLTEFKIYSIIAQHGVKLVIPDTCPEQLASLLRECWHTRPRDRLDMKKVVSCLEHMRGDTNVRRECAHFVEQKHQWQDKIKEQLAELDAMKLDLASKLEELKKREQALRQRERSHRNFLNMIDYIGFDNVAEWNEDCVCEWIQKIAASPGVDEVLTNDIVDRMISSVLQYDINGARLLKVTEKDLENLGMDSPSVRKFLCSEIAELQLKNEAAQQPIKEEFSEDFPSLQASAAEMERQNGSEERKIKPPTIDYSIVLHVGLYTRISQQRHRFKAFLDSDWAETELQHGIEANIPLEIRDSSTLIRDVCFSMVSATKGVVLLETVRCMCPPFGYLEWVEVDEAALPVKLTCAVTYTDQVIHPRNTRVNVTIEDVNESRSLLNKTVALKLRSRATPSSLTRISSSHHFLTKSPEPVVHSSSLQGVWRKRADSFGNDRPLLSWDRKIAVNKRSPDAFPRPMLYAEIASISPFVTIHRHSRSSGAQSPETLASSRSEVRHEPSASSASMEIRGLTTSARTYRQHRIGKARSSKHFLFIPNRAAYAKEPSPLHSASTSRPPARESERIVTRGGRKNSEPNSIGRRRTPTEHATFFVEPDSPDSPEGRGHETGEKANTEGGDTNHTKEGSEKRVREVPNRCCAGSCRQRTNFHTKPPLEEEVKVNEKNLDEGVTESKSLSINTKRRAKRLSAKASMRKFVHTVQLVRHDVEKATKQGATDADELASRLKESLSNMGSRCSGESCKIYGGYNKWKWRG